MNNDTYQKKDVKVQLTNDYSEDFEVWKLPLRYEGERFSKGFAYILMLDYTYCQLTNDELHVEGVDDEELFTLANTLLLLERAGIRDWIYKHRSINEAYQILDIYNKYYRSIIRDTLNMRILSNNYVITEILPEHYGYTDKFNIINSSMKKVDGKMYGILMTVINSYLMEKLDRMSTEEKNKNYLY